MPFSAAAATERALVAASFGRHFYVRPLSGAWADRVAVTRGKRTDLCVGDEVEVRTLGVDQAVIESLHARRTLLQRSDRWRARLLAANVDQAGIVIAGEPHFSESLAMRMLMAIETAGVSVALIVNKCDRLDTRRSIERRLAVYREIGYPTFDIAAGADARATCETLGGWLAGRTTLLLGESGMGKSTLVNALVPDAQLRTQAISEALGTGKHTTTFSRLFDLPQAVAADARIIDSPGFQTFGLSHLSDSQRMHAMREFVPLLGRCRFNNCTHQDEPGCAIRTGAERGDLDSLRYRLYSQIENNTD